MTIFYDIETRTWAGDHPRGWEEIELFGLAVAVTWCECHGWVAWSADKAAGLYQYLISHDRIVGFNIVRFDNTIVAHDAGQPREALDQRSFDILVDLTARLGHRVKLEQVALATLGRGKSGAGDQAVAWWKVAELLSDYEPDVAEMYLQRVKDYCGDDVELERDIYRFGCEHGYVRYASRGKIEQIAVDWGQG
jgi:DEAD/DEAH box helicase domain-containing protein